LQASFTFSPAFEVRLDLVHLAFGFQVSIIRASPTLPELINAG